MAMTTLSSAFRHHPTTTTILETLSLVKMRAKQVNPLCWIALSSCFLIGVLIHHTSIISAILMVNLFLFFFIHPTELKAIQPTESYCTICMESKPIAEIFTIGSCSHSFCNSCVALYVATKVAENTVTISCPGCNDGKLDLESCRGIVGIGVMERWERGLCEETIQAKFYCPFRDCSAVLADERGGMGVMIREAECPYCYRLFCAVCQVSWHAGVTCEEFQKDGEVIEKNVEKGKKNWGVRKFQNHIFRILCPRVSQNAREWEEEKKRKEEEEKEKKGVEKRNDMMVKQMAERNQWQKCPKCKFYVERIDGCMFIKCRCGYGFCYGCGSQMGKNHYCLKCRR